MSRVYERLSACYESIRRRTDFCPRVALVLGSGLGGYGKQIDVKDQVSYRDIEGFPVSTVPGHEGRFLFGYVGGVPVAAMQGRIHYYEGYSMEEVVLPIRLLRQMGAEILFLTNAAGGLNEEFAAGDLMMITDQIANFVPSPLIGPNPEELGPRFCDMSRVYDESLGQILRQTAADLGIPLREGVYIQLTGPAFETPHEVKMCRILGADAVGMSTACEAIAANHMGMQICGISCISNLGCGMTENPLSHQEVQETADRIAPVFEQLVTEAVKRMGSL